MPTNEALIRRLREENERLRGKVWRAEANRLSKRIEAALELLESIPPHESEPFHSWASQSEPTRRELALVKAIEALRGETDD